MKWKDPHTIYAHVEKDLAWTNYANVFVSYFLVLAELFIPYVFIEYA